MRRVLARELSYDPADGLYLLDDVPFSGEACTLAPGGQEKARMQYRDGLRWGLTTERYPSGQPMVEATFFRGVLHGRAREWHPDGQPAEDGEYEYGITLREKHWDEQGRVTRDYILRDTDPAYPRLLQMRRLHGAGDPPDSR